MNGRFPLGPRCRWLPFLLVVSFLLCCSTAPKETGSEPPAPEWVRSGLATFEGDDGRAFFGVGSCSNYKSLPMAETAAAGRARAQIAAVLETHISSCVERAVTASIGTTPGAAQTSEIQEHIIEARSQVDLSGVKIVEYWRDARNGTVYALARLDLSRFKEYLKRVLSGGDTARKTAPQ